MKQAFVVLMVGILALSTTLSVTAQDPTPSPTQSATPQYETPLELSSGNAAILERRVTYGDLMIILAVVALSCVEMYSLLVRLLTKWLL